MNEWPVKLRSMRPISVDSTGTNDNIPIRIGLVYTAAEVKFYPYSNKTFSAPSVPLYHSSMLLACRESIKSFFYDEKLIL